MTSMVNIECTICKKIVVKNKAKYDFCKKRNSNYTVVCPECKEKKRRDSVIEVECEVCGTKIIRNKKYFESNKMRNPNYKPTCSMECRAQQTFLKKRGTCNVLKQHHKNVGGDPDHLSTESIISIMCESSPTLGAYHGARQHTSRKQKTANNHKGQRSAERWNRLNTLVKQGKASWWMPYRNSVEEALTAAGLYI